MKTDRKTDRDTYQAVTGMFIVQHITDSIPVGSVLRFPDVTGEYHS